MNDTDRLDYLSRQGPDEPYTKILALLGPLNRGVQLRKAIDDQMGADQEFYEQRGRELAEAREGVGSYQDEVAEYEELRKRGLFVNRSAGPDRTVITIRRSGEAPDGQLIGDGTELGEGQE